MFLSGFYELCINSYFFVSTSQDGISLLLSVVIYIYILILMFESFVISTDFFHARREHLILKVQSVTNIKYFLPLHIV